LQILIVYGIKTNSLYKIIVGRPRRLKVDIYSEIFIRHRQNMVLAQKLILSAMYGGVVYEALILALLRLPNTSN
jgi:hypothetical protein